MSLQVFHLNSSSSSTTINKEIKPQFNNEPFILIFQSSRDRHNNNAVPKKELLIKNLNVIDVKVSHLHCIILDNSGKVYYLKNELKERFVDKFIDGDASCQPQLINFTIEDPIKKIFGKNGCMSILLSTSCGESYFLLLTETGKVFGIGPNTWGELGKASNGFTDLIESKIDHIPSKIVKVYATFSNSFALTEDGELYTCGSKDFAANGMEFNSIYDTNTFTKVPSKERVVEVYNGYLFAAVKTIDSKFYVFGDNRFNQFGNIQTSSSEEKIYSPTLLNTFNTNEIKDMDCGGYGLIIITSKLYFILN